MAKTYSKVFECSVMVEKNGQKRLIEAVIEADTQKAAGKGLAHIIADLEPERAMVVDVREVAIQ